MTTLVLVGLMAAGWSTVGRIVADRLGWPLVNSDRAIEARTGRSVLAPDAVLERLVARLARSSAPSK